MHNADAQSGVSSLRVSFSCRKATKCSVAAVDFWLAQTLDVASNNSRKAENSRAVPPKFSKSNNAPVRAANARVLSAQSLQELQRTASAIAEAQRALQELEGFHAPWVSYQAFNTLGKLRETEGERNEAEALYMRAITELELLRGNIKLDELRMSFGKDKYQVYENIVSVKLGKGDSRTAFEFVERSKSRTLIDQMERSVETAWDAGERRVSPLAAHSEST